MEKFICKECNYKFNSKVSQIGKKCPYCGKKALIKELNAEELIEGL